MMMMWKVSHQLFCGWLAAIVSGLLEISHHETTWHIQLGGFWSFFLSFLFTWHYSFWHAFVLLKTLEDWLITAMLSTMRPEWQAGYWCCHNVCEWLMTHIWIWWQHPWYSTKVVFFELWYQVTYGHLYGRLQMGIFGTVYHFYSTWEWSLGWKRSVPGLPERPGPSFHNSTQNIRYLLSQI